MTYHTILVAEDEDLLRGILSGLLRDEGYRVLEAADGTNALDMVSREDVTLVISDINMPGVDGLELLNHIKNLNSNALVIMITAYSSVDSAVAALRKGAYDYLTKPFVNEDLLQTVKNAIAHQQLYAENRYLRRELKQRNRFENLIGTSEALQQVLRVVEKISATTSTVLITGESGTGKELIAQAIHYNSERGEGPFVAINCGALPDHLLESELFGYVKGAFTGAVANKRGLLQTANGGTLLLDEIGEMPMSLQVKLLRALQDRSVTPLGSTQSIGFDARILAATNRDLEADVKAGRFREDLFYRLNVININMPPLRSRREDIPLMARHFVRRLAAARSLAEPAISSDAMTQMVNYDWPGNVRELENCIERALALCDKEIGSAELPPNVQQAGSAYKTEPAVPVSLLTLDAMERQYILDTLEREHGDKARAAKVLGIDLSTLYRKLNRYNIRRNEA